jgi:hypothetical protein
MMDADQMPIDGAAQSAAAEDGERESYRASRQYGALLEEFFWNLNEAISPLAKLPMDYTQKIQLDKYSKKLGAVGDINPAISDLDDLVSLARELLFKVGRQKVDDLDTPGVRYRDMEDAYFRASQILSGLRALRIQQQIENVERAARQSVSEIGATTLQEDFGGAYKLEWRAAFWLRILSFLLLAVAAGIAIWVAHEAKQLDWKSEAARLGIAVPFLGAAYFSASEARDHRRYARKERGWQTRINSLEAFCSPLPEELKNEVRAGFAKVLYADPPDFGNPDSLADSNQKALDQALSILQVVRGDRIVKDV